MDHPDHRRYDFGPSHPLRPERIHSGFDLLRETGILADADVMQPPAAGREELALVHSSQYIAAVEKASTGDLTADELIRFGLAAGDNPAFPDMHGPAARVAGGSIAAVRGILRDEIDHAFNPAGGLHHAVRDRASGFCIYNDPAIAAAVAVREFGARVLYVDFDCHHGDGVQWLFYGDPRVMTVSFHESGRYLFPGTGSVDETGEGAGRGFSVNIPFEPFTQDESWLAAIESVLPPIARRFAPDLIISAHGADTHHWDPLTHVSLTTRSLAGQALLIHGLAHEMAAGRWLAVGSGGYDWRRVVPRSWAIVWSEMTSQPLPQRLPEVWRDRWQGRDPMPALLLDDPDLPGTSPQGAEIERANTRSVRAALAVAG